MSKPPKCRACRKPLRKYLYFFWKHQSETRPVPSVGELWPDRNLTILEVTTKPGKSGGLPNSPAFNVWCGEWGYRGNGYFCSQGCGYRYAMWILKHREEQHAQV